MAKGELHGLAATIRSATESETFDLGGLPSTTISQVIRDTFSQDFDLGGAGMIRITLVVGAGKGDRSKYDPAALKLVTTALSAAGYREDRGASCVVESAGCYKFQHDTGKNLKTVVVFPKILEKSGGDSNTASSSTSSSLLPPNSLEYKIAVSTVPLFTNMLKFKFHSWSQKRSLLKIIDESLVEPLEALDASLMKGGLMSEDERIFYEQCLSVSEKKGLVKDAMSQQVQDEQLTASEVNFLLEQVAARIEELKSKKQSINDGLQQRQAKLRSIAKNPISPAPLKHHATLGKLWKQAAPLMYLNASDGKLLSPAETKKRGKLEDILGEIADLEESSRGLLEEDESYEERILAYRRELQQRFGNLSSGNGKQKKSGAIGSSSSLSSSSNRKTNAWNTTTKYHTPNLGGRGGNGGWMSGKNKKKKKGGMNKGDLFGAMMADSDSDSEEEESNDTRNVTSLDRVNTSGATSDVTTSSGVANDSGGTTAASKKKNKKKKKKKNKHGDADDAILDAAVAANTEALKKKTKTKDGTSVSETKVEDGKSDIVSNLFSILFLTLTEFIIPIILAIFTWLATTLFGSNKKKKKKKSN
mmetsp:Transcript_20800/g.48964  ORF Transcript_20800/g.48964 Transcript_20800/m.48964 type:complete len:588 (+) Transcript_20800:96-1859(+)